jgi:hypothetical protein
MKEMLETLIPTQETRKQTATLSPFSLDQELYAIILQNKGKSKVLYASPDLFIPYVIAERNNYI